MDLKIFSGKGSARLLKDIAAYLRIKAGAIERTRFSDGELRVQYRENIRGSDVFVVQSTNQPHENIIELFLLLDAARRGSAGRITAVIPYFGYARQDRKDRSRVSVGAKLFANLVVVAGAHRVLTVDLHKDQQDAFFDIPVDHLSARPVFTETFSRRFSVENLTVLAPDAGAVARARAFAERLGECSVVFLDKRRVGPNRSQVLHLVGEVAGRNILIVDDMIDTGGTIVQAADTLKSHGAGSVWACATHGVLSGKGRERIVMACQEKKLDGVFITDTIALRQATPGIECISVAPLLAEAIKRIHNNDSVSALFE